MFSIPLGIIVSRLGISALLEKSLLLVPLGND